MKTKKAFTLIEMLIVVVIIGILAAALIPRLQSVQGRARDTKRKADLNQVGSALAIYKSDVGNYAALTGGSTAGLVSTLVTNGSYLTAMPVDSDQSTWNAASAAPFTSLTNYAFNPLARNGSASGAFILMARTETDGTSSNWVYSSSTATTGAINTTGDASAFESAICTRTTATTSATSLVAGGVCNALKTASDLRYVYVQ